MDIEIDLTFRNRPNKIFSVNFCQESIFSVGENEIYEYSLEKGLNLLFDESNFPENTTFSGLKTIVRCYIT